MRAGYGYRSLNENLAPLRRYLRAQLGRPWDDEETLFPTGNATREHDEGNPRKFYVGIEAMIPDIRQRQSRDVPMQCGSQSANIRVIHRRHIASRVAFPVESDS
jgi:hypothetical protein